MRYPILRQKEVAESLWAYRDSVMDEARAEMHEEAFLKGTSDPSVAQREFEAEGERAVAAVKAAYDALEIALQAAKKFPPETV
jgi:hypothetical protein